MHSKGPWKPCNMAFKGGKADDNIWDVYSDDGELLAVSVSKSDAALIAAAPLMLEALRAVLEIYDEPCRLDHHGLCQTHHLRRNDAGEPECEVELIRAAIAATEGRSE